MKITLNGLQRMALGSKLMAEMREGKIVFDIDFQSTVGDGSGESTQIAVNERWLHRDGTWHDGPEPPKTRYLVKHKKTGNYFLGYIHGGEDWTDNPEKAVWWSNRDITDQFIRTDEVLAPVCEIEEYTRP